jgi:hypothetical protein
MHLFEDEDQLGYEVVKHKLQTNFPTELFGVRMYAVKPTVPEKKKEKKEKKEKVVVE